MSPGQESWGSSSIEVFTYKRVGGSVSHSAFDLMVNFGLNQLALVGQDLAFAQTGELYTDHARLICLKTGSRQWEKGFHVKRFLW